MSFGMALILGLCLLYVIHAVLLLSLFRTSHVAELVRRWRSSRAARVQRREQMRLLCATNERRVA